MTTLETITPLRIGPALLLAVGAIASFTLAYAFANCACLVVLFLVCLLPLTRLATRRQSFYFGLGVGLAIYTPHLLFFWTHFRYGAIALWYILPFWLGLFLMLGHSCLYRFGPVAWTILAPFLWTGFEFFRGELYFLRFTWLSIGYAFSGTELLPFMSRYGFYGIGFLAAALANAMVAPKQARWFAAGLLVLAALNPLSATNGTAPSGQKVRVAGIQWEFPTTSEVLLALNGAIAKYPSADIYVMSETTFQGPVPRRVQDWCREHRKFFVAGGQDPVAPANYFNTAFVVDTNGAVVFRQAKCVPVQLMKDGLPATNQQVWSSPWGKIGLGICYDASYRRVTDELIRQGAKALIFPTMDVDEWGLAEHQLHSRVPLMRAAEYGVPIFRVCSSGISEFVDNKGQVAASAPYPGQGDTLFTEMTLPGGGRLPPDRWLAWLSVSIVAAMSAWLAMEAVAHKFNNRKLPSSIP